MLTVTWIGQAGLLLKTGERIIMIDPYFTDSVGEKDPIKHRRVPINEELFDIKPDIMIFTHSHLDHYDPETVKRFIKADSCMTVLAPSSVWSRVRELGGNNNYVLFNRYTEWSEGNIRFKAVKAEHSDPTPIGVIIEAEGKKYYVTGDTLYNEEIFSDLPRDIYAVFLPINGAGNNMNMVDAARFSNRVAPDITVPIHIGMFDSLSADDFICDTKQVLELYTEVEL
jgi:L-ascorbate metabolism protein UlaG (beta-lactamase superfamily)